MHSKAQIMIDIDAIWLYSCSTCLNQADPLPLLFSVHVPKLNSVLVFSLWSFCCLFVAKCMGIEASPDGSAPLSETWLSQLDD